MADQWLYFEGGGGLGCWSLHRHGLGTYSGYAFAKGKLTFGGGELELPSPLVSAGINVYNGYNVI